MMARRSYLAQSLKKQPMHNMSDPYFLETSRLRYRFFTAADFDFFFSLQSDAEMMRYIRPPESDPDKVRERMNQILDHMSANPGMGSMLDVMNTGDAVVASGVVRHIEYQPGKDLEIGYLVTRPYWGRGFATEFAQGLTDYAFEKFGVQKVTAVVHPENQASQQVLRKCGFELTGRRFIYDSDNLEFVRPR